jgi:hypothetical protein
MTNKVGVFNSIVDRTFTGESDGVVSCGIVITGRRGSQGVRTINSLRQFIDEYGTPRKTDISMLAAIRYLRRARFLNVVRVVNDAVAASFTITDEATFTAKNAGAWGNDIDIDFVTIADAPAGVFGVSVKFKDSQVEFHEVSLNPEQKNGFGRNIFIENVLNLRSNYVDVAVDEAFTGAAFTPLTITLAAGADDTSAPTPVQISDGWELFKNKEDVDTRFLINAGLVDPIIQAKMSEVAAYRGDCLPIFDLPLSESYDTSDMILYRDDDLALDTHFGSIYGGWLKVQDQFNDAEVWIPPSADVAANWTTVIGNGEYWLAAMGIETGVIPDVIDVSLRMDDTQRTEIYAKGINPVTKIGSNVAVMMGQKTLQRLASGMDRMNVVNNVLWMSNRLETILMRFVGRPNTKFQRDNANYACTSFLEGVKRKEGVYDFAVDTSDSLNTPEVIDNQEFFVDVYVQPTRIMEAINLRLIVTPTGVRLSQ